MRFYDRAEELSILSLNEKQSYETAVFTVLTGRRRVGKTSLITKAINDEGMAYLFVSKDSEPILCRRFQETVSEKLGVEIHGQTTTVRELFEILMKESQKRHFTVFFDEFQNFQKVNPAIFSDMQDIWDKYHGGSRIHLVVSGSIRSLMKRIFEDSSEPLYGRPTSKMQLRPFRTDVLKEIISENNPSWKNEDLLCLYMITGGVAKYVELLVDAGCLTKKKMLDFVCRSDSYFLTEGRDLLSQEFNEESSTYFSVLQLIAGGMTKRSEIDGIIGKDMGVYLQNLEKNFFMIRRMKPLLSKPGSKTTAYEIADPFLRFWFRFIWPFQSLVETRQLGRLREYIERNYEQFSGNTLEHYFQQKLVESGNYTLVGNWWDRKGLNEVDIVALDEFTHKGVVAEVKRNPRKIDLAALKKKTEAFPAPFREYDLKLEGFSLDSLSEI